MDERTYRGNLTPDDLANVLLAQFNQGGFMAQRVGQGERVMVQIGKRDRRHGVENALAVNIVEIPDGVNVALGQQQWMDVAADLAQAGLGALFNPWSLLGNIGEIARDVGSLSLPTQVWQTIDSYCKSVGGALGGAPAEMMIKCEYCGAANPAGTAVCSACGAGLGDVQPIYCPQCGQAAHHDSQFCSRCGARLTRS